MTSTLHARLLMNAVSVERGDLAPLCDAAKQHRVTVVCGINERDEDVSRSTLYNAVVVIGADGTILNKHRKLMPTNPERMVWGFGDGSSAQGRRHALRPHRHADLLGELHAARALLRSTRRASRSTSRRPTTAATAGSARCSISRAKACCWVIGSGTVMRASDLPADFPERERLYADADEWINDGDSVVVAPGGAIAAGPMRKATGMLHRRDRPRRRRAWRAAGSMSPGITRAPTCFSCT